MFYVVLGLLFASILGLIGGTAVNFVSTRLARHRPFFGAPGCTRSHHPLGWWQVLPLLGYLMQRGRCSICGRTLPVTYPLTELLTGLLFVVQFLLEGWSAAYLFHAIYVLFLLVVLVVDLRHRDIYFSVIIAGSAVALLGSMVLPGADVLNALLAAGVAGGFFLLAYGLARLIFRHVEEPLGTGDVLLALMMGLMLGFPNIVGALLIGPLLAGGAAVLLLLSRRRRLGDFMPYGVALCVATIIFLVYPGPLADALKLPALRDMVNGLFGG